MRHLRVINHLGRTSSHRKAMMANMATSLILHKRITTTTAKAKALRTYVEPLITKSKDDSTHSRRVVFSYLKDKEAVSVLFREISPKIAERPGGYTRILKTGKRLGDNADMCIIELVDYNEALIGGGTAKTKTRRRRSRKKEETAEVTKTPKAAKDSAGKAEKKVKTQAPVKKETEAIAEEAVSDKAGEAAESITEQETEAVSDEAVADKADETAEEKKEETSGGETPEKDPAS
jgi:large subunit ribosomal protein L17